MTARETRHNIEGPRPTRAAALLVATVLGWPVFLLLCLIDWLFL